MGIIIAKQNYSSKLNGKKLLIIGATAYFIDVVKICRKMGIISIVIDYNPNAKAKPFADIALDIDTYNEAEVLRIAKKYEVDGVFVGWSDRNLYTALFVCESMGLPFYANKEQLNDTTDKSRFRALCIKNKVPVIQEKYLETVKDDDFPVIVKPVDNGGNRGIAVCSNQSELLEKYKIAKSFSRNGKVIIEKHLNLQHINIYYTLIDGNYYLSTMCDRYVMYPQKGYPPLPSVLVHDSNIYDQYIKEVDPKIKDMFRSINMKDGIAFLQAFTDGTEFYIYEMGYRLNGGSTYLFIDYFYQYNQIEMLINYALSGKMDSGEHSIYQHKGFEKKGITYILSLRNGVIKSIKGTENLKKHKEVLDYIQMYNIGDEINIGDGVSQSQIFIYIYLIVENCESLGDVMKEIRQEISVTDMQGKEMLIDSFNTIGENNG